MADEIQDSAQNTGVQGESNPDASQDSSGQPRSEIDAAKLQADLESLTQSVAGLSKAVSTMQSGKDRAVKDVRQEVGELRTLFGDYEKLKERFGADGAMEQLELRQTLSDIQGQLSKLSGSPSTQSLDTGAGGAVNAAKTFAELGLDLKNSFVVDALGKQYASAEDAELAAYRLQRQIQQSPNPSDTQDPAIQGNASKLNVDALTQEYKKNMLAARGKESQLTKIREQAIKDGVPVWTVDFS